MLEDFDSAYRKLELNEEEINRKKNRLAWLINEGYDNKDYCDKLKDENNKKIAENNSIYESEIKSLEEEKIKTGEPTQADMNAAEAELLQTCNSSNKSWYQGFFGSSVTAVAVGIAGLWYWYAR